MPIGICLNCNREFKYKSIVFYGKYCSNDCQHEYQNNEKYTKWLNGENSWKDSKGLKRAVIRKDGYICSECKITEWNGKSIVLDLEHKDGNSFNNKPDNLCLICPNCHSQTGTFKGKNRGKGRHFRRERYKAGKSF